MLEAGSGSVINVASFVAVMGAAVSQGSYTASKGAVLALSRELGVEFAARGVRVNALCPGPVNTPLLKELLRQRPRARREAPRPRTRWAASASPRRSPRPLSSWPANESSFVTASTFLADGGLSSAYITPSQVD